MARKIKRHRNRSGNTAHVIDSVKRDGAVRREVHFALGHSLREWSPGNVVFKDRRKDKNKKACRGRVKDW